MNDIPRSYLRINVFKKNKEALAELAKEYSKKQEHSDDEVQVVFDKIKVCFEFYKKSLRDILKEKEIVLYLPTEILKRAQDEKIIQDAEVWLNYIDDLNEIIQSQVPAAAAILRKKVVENYIDKPLKSWKFLEKQYNPRVLDNFAKETSNKPLPENKPEYAPEEMGLNQSRYDKFISFCKEHPAIKRVWLHGSRAKGNFVETTDIDCLCDIDNYDEYKKICLDLKYIPIPNRIDFAQINDIQDSFYNNAVKHAKIIYRAEDFQ